MNEYILILDDEIAVCNMLTKFLSKKGYRTKSTTSVQEALEIINKEKPQILLLDIKMPDMDGITVLKKVKEIDQVICVIMITAVKDDDTGRECIRLGAYDYITKPLSLDYLSDVLMVKLLDFQRKSTKEGE